MGGTGVIDGFLDTFARYIDSGFGLIHGDVGFLAGALIVIDVTLAFLFWTWGEGEDIIARLVRKTIQVGFFAFLIGNWNGLAKIIYLSFSGLGLKAAGSGTASDLLHPGRIAQIGIDAGQPLLDQAATLGGFPGIVVNFVQIAVLLLAWAIVCLAFFIIAIQLFVTLIEFKLVTLAGFRAGAVRPVWPHRLPRRARARQRHGDRHQSARPCRHHRHRLDDLQHLHRQLRRDAADARAGRVDRARQPDPARTRHLRPRHRRRADVGRPAARSGRGDRYRPRRRRRRCGRWRRGCGSGGPRDPCRCECRGLAVALGRPVRNGWVVERRSRRAVRRSGWRWRAERRRAGRRGRQHRCPGVGSGASPPPDVAQGARLAAHTLRSADHGGGSAHISLEDRS